MNIKQLQQQIHQQNKEAGWWDNPRKKGTLLCLIHSEISEAMEGERKNLMDNHLPHRKWLKLNLLMLLFVFWIMPKPLAMTLKAPLMKSSNTTNIAQTINVKTAQRKAVSNSNLT